MPDQLMTLAAQETLQESERFLQEAQEAGGVGTYCWRIPEDRWQGSRYLDRIFGIDETYPRNLEGWTRLIAPGDRQEMDAYVAGIIARREDFDHEYRIIRPCDGAHRWVHGRGRITWNEEGQPLSLTGVIQDITERRMAEAALRASEEKFSKAFHASPDSVNINRLSDGLYLAVNEGFTKITGYAAEEVLGRSSLPGDLGIWVREEDRARLREGLLRTGEVVGLEAPFRRRDGGLLTGLMSASIIEIEGEPAVLSITRDITEFKEQARQLEKRTRMYAALSQVNQAIVWSPDRQSLLDKICEVMVDFGKFDLARIAWHDPATNQVCGVATRGDAHERPDGTQACSLGLPLELDPAARAIRAGTAHVSNDLTAAFGAAPAQGMGDGRAYAAAAAFPIRQGGEVRGALAVYSKEKGFFGSDEVALLEEAAGDISFALDHLDSEQRRKDLEARLQQSQKLENLGSLASGIAHDMNNVLGAILVMASVKVEALPAENPERRAFEIISQAAERGGDMIKRLLNFARKRPAQEQEVDLNALLEEQAEFLSRTTLGRIRLATDLEPDLGPVRGDPTALTHAIMNLCVNAVDAMPEGGLLTLRTLAAGPGWSEVQVEDTGLGMTADVLDKALDPFFTTKEDGKGTGLGLPLVHSTVKAHGGQISLWSEPGRGTRVSLRLPVALEAPGAWPGESRPGTGLPLRSLRILIAEDDDLVRLSLVELARAQGHDALAVRGGREALQALEEGLDPDLVVMDLNMPGLDGARTLPALRAFRPAVPVMLVTGRMDQKALDLMAEHPRVAILPKPFSAEAFRRQLQDLGIS